MPRIWAKGALWVGVAAIAGLICFADGGSGWAQVETQPLDQSPGQEFPAEAVPSLVVGVPDDGDAPDLGEAGGAPVPAPTPRVLILDFEGVMARSQAALAIRDQLEGLRAGYQEELEQVELELRGAERELSRIRGTVTETEFANRLRIFEERIQSLQGTTQARVVALERAEEAAFANVRRVLLEVLSDSVEERGANLVLRSNLVLVAESNMDITEEALARLNERLPHVDVVLPLIE